MTDQPLKCTKCKTEKMYTEQQVLDSLTKLKFDCIYCFGDGIRDIKVENYINVEMR